MAYLVSFWLDVHIFIWPSWGLHHLGDKSLQGFRERRKTAAALKYLDILGKPTENLCDHVGLCLLPADAVVLNCDTLLCLKHQYKWLWCCTNVTVGTRQPMLWPSARLREGAQTSCCSFMLKVGSWTGSVILSRMSLWIQSLDIPCDPGLLWDLSGGTGKCCSVKLECPV